MGQVAIRSGRSRAPDADALPGVLQYSLGSRKTPRWAAASTCCCTVNGARYRGAAEVTRGHSHAWIVNWQPKNNSSASSSNGSTTQPAEQRSSSAASSAASGTARDGCDSSGQNKVSHSKDNKWISYSNFSTERRTCGRSIGGLSENFSSASSASTSQNGSGAERLESRTVRDKSRMRSQCHSISSAGEADDAAAAAADGGRRRRRRGSIDGRRPAGRRDAASQGSLGRQEKCRAVVAGFGICGS